MPFKLRGYKICSYRIKSSVLSNIPFCKVLTMKTNAAISSVNYNTPFVHQRKTNRTHILPQSFKHTCQTGITLAQHIESSFLQAHTPYWSLTAFSLCTSCVIENRFSSLMNYVCFVTSFQYNLIDEIDIMAVCVLVYPYTSEDRRIFHVIHN